ncbi:MAG TPA: peptidoglycan-binding protein [Pseudolabrys sp.]
MKRNLRTILMGTVALMAGVGLASAQGMRDVPGADRGAAPTSSDQMKPGASGSHREMNSTQGKAQKSETRGQAQRGPSNGDMDKRQAKSHRPERSTTGQASDQDELSKSPSSRTSKGRKADEMKSRSSAKDSAKDKANSKSSAKKDEKSTIGQASKEKSEKSTTGQGSSENKASSDSKQQMNRQSQNPNADRQNQTTGSRSNTTEQSNAGIRSQAGVQVSAQQRTTIQRSVLQARNVPRVDRVNFSIHTGTVVPRDVHIVSVTTFPVLIEAFPRYRDYSFFVVEDEVVFVDRSHKIVDVVPIGGGAHFGSSSTSTTVAVDLSEPEIREIQTVLIREGFLHGRVTGVFDTRTREALIGFQRKRGFEANGRIDTRTVSALGLEGKVKVKSENGSSSSSSQESSGAQKSGTTGQGADRGQSGDQRPNDRGTTGQGPATTQKNATPDKGPSESRGSGEAQPAQKDQRSGAPNRSTTGQGSDKSTPGMSDQGNSGSSQPATADRNERRRQ